MILKTYVGTDGLPSGILELSETVKKLWEYYLEELFLYAGFLSKFFGKLKKECEGEVIVKTPKRTIGISGEMLKVSKRNFQEGILVKFHAYTQVQFIIRDRSYQMRIDTYGETRIARATSPEPKNPVTRWFLEKAFPSEGLDVIEFKDFISEEVRNSVLLTTGIEIL